MGDSEGRDLVELGGEGMDGLLADEEAARQERLVEGMLLTDNMDDLARVAGYSDAVQGYKATGREKVQIDLRASVERRSRTTGLSKAYRTVCRLMDPSNPPAVQLGAAKLMFALNGMGDGMAPAEPKEIHLTDAQLERFVKANDKLMKPVTPSRRA
jgi:hypothetical protein